MDIVVTWAFDICCVFFQSSGQYHSVCVVRVAHRSWFRLQCRL